VPIDFCCSFLVFLFCLFLAVPFLLEFSQLHCPEVRSGESSRCSLLAVCACSLCYSARLAFPRRTAASSGSLTHRAINSQQRNATLQTIKELSPVLCSCWPVYSALFLLDSAPLVLPRVFFPFHCNRTRRLHRNQSTQQQAEQFNASRKEKQNELAGG
jgi:hypothetical protein